MGRVRDRRRRVLEVRPRMDKEPGGGQRGVKQNESIQGLVKISDRMSKLLITMGIKPDTAITEEEDEIIDL